MDLFEDVKFAPKMETDAAFLLTIGSFLLTIELFICN